MLKMLDDVLDDMYDNCLTFRVSATDKPEFKNLLSFISGIKSCNNFKGAKVAKAIKNLVEKNLVMFFHVSFGREYSPVIYLRFNPKDAARVKKAVKDLEADEVTQPDKFQLRLWWD